MRILVDINHPAHVHYFRNFIQKMEEKGHRFCVINRDGEMINQLLDYYGIKHTIRNKRPGHRGIMASFFNLTWMIGKCIQMSFSFKPDIYMGFASSACSITSWLFKKPCILMDDTEHNSMNHRIYLPFCSKILTPFYFQKTLGDGSKQIRFNAYVEQLYLHSNYFQKKDTVLQELGVKPHEYVVIRYIAYDAHHDLKCHPFPEIVKRQIVTAIARQYQVFVSLEDGIADSFYDKYKLIISPEKMHDLMAYAKFLITEGATMASESFVMGVPYLYINPLRCGYIDYQCEHYPKYAFQTQNDKEAINIVENLMQMEPLSEGNREKVERETIAPTAFLIDYIEQIQSNPI